MLDGMASAVLEAIGPRNFRRIVFHDRCWLWRGATTSGGYPLVNRAVAPKTWKRFYVRRLVWEAVHGPIPPRGVITTTCLRLACVRPEHLELTTHAEAARAGQLRRWHPNP